MRPVAEPYTVTQTFGVPDPNALFKLHSGYDYAVAMRSQVFSPPSGTVRYAQSHPVRGKMVGIFDGKDTHRLMHNDQLLVKVGDRVKVGMVVALSGTTGLSTGPHVHWDIISGDRMDATTFQDFIDPDVWLNGESRELNEIGGPMQIKNRHQAKLAYVAIQHRVYEKVTDKEADGIIGLNIEQLVGMWLYGEKSKADAAEWHNANYKMANFDRIITENAELRTQKLAAVTRDTALEYITKNLK